LGHKTYVPFFSNIFPWIVHSFPCEYIYIYICIYIYIYIYIHTHTHTHIQQLRA
jgi:hypothetical protein